MDLVFLLGGTKGAFFICEHEYGLQTVAKVIIKANFK